jgi:hypothetical protein
MRRIEEPEVKTPDPILSGPIIACLGSVANRGARWDIEERGREQQDRWRADRTFASARQRTPSLCPALGLSPVSARLESLRRYPSRTGRKGPLTYRGCRRSRSTRQNAHPRRNALPHYAGMLRSGLRLQPQANGNDAGNSLAASGRVGRLSAKQHGPKTGGVVCGTAQFLTNTLFHFDHPRTDFEVLPPGAC